VKRLAQHFPVPVRVSLEDPLVLIPHETTQPVERMLPQSRWSIVLSRRFRDPLGGPRGSTCTYGLCTGRLSLRGLRKRLFS